MSHRLIRTCQVLTAAAAVFTILWACGNPPTRPSAPDAAALRGTWDGSFSPPPDPALPGELTIDASGNVPIPTLRAGGVTYGPDSTRTSTVASRNFVFNMTNGATQISLIGAISADGTRLTGQAAGLAPVQRAFTFTRR